MSEWWQRKEMPREYYEIKLEDCREAHQDVTAMLGEATGRNEIFRVYNLTLERKRLAGIFVEIQAHLK